MAEITKIYCPNCRELKRFIQVVEVHIETEDLVHHKYAPIGPMSLKRWVAKTELPLAYCSICRTVIFIGPSPEEVEKKFAEMKKV